MYKFKMECDGNANEDDEVLEVFETISSRDCTSSPSPLTTSSHIATIADSAANVGADVGADADAHADAEVVPPYSPPIEHTFSFSSYDATKMTEKVVVFLATHKVLFYFICRILKSLIIISLHT